MEEMVEKGLKSIVVIIAGSLRALVTIWSGNLPFTNCLVQYSSSNFYNNGYCDIFDTLISRAHGVFKDD